MRKLILSNRQCLGDDAMLTATIRDLHAAYPGQFQTDVRTACPAIWENNPHITPLREDDPGVEVIQMHCPLIHQSNQLPYHYLHAFTQFLEQMLGLRIPVTKFSGDIHLTDEEKSAPPLEGYSLPEWFWLIVSGGKYDFTAKWWNPAYYQQVVDHYRGKLAFVQIGEAGDFHPALNGVLNLVGKTSLRQLIRLVYFCAGGLCPVTGLMHLIASIETPPGRPKHRPCIIPAGGREPGPWEAYPHHQLISTVGALTCCEHGAC